MKKGMLLLMFIYVFVGCHPGGPEYVDELDTVYTNYSPEFDFTNTYTYSLPDAVINITDQSFFGGNPDYIDPDFSDAILSRLRSNLNENGWTEVDESEDPEIIILASAFESEFYYYYDPGYWGGYYPGYGPGWDWYYPGYPPGFVGTYTTGTVLIQMTEPTMIMNDMVPVVWLEALNGLLQGSKASIVKRIEFGMDQAFNQPPFNN